MKNGLEPKKERIILTATKIFSAKGYFSTSVQEIAEECSMSKASLYKLFPSKEDLFIEVFEYHQNILFDKVASISFASHYSPRELLIKQISTQIEVFLEQRNFITMQLKEIPLSGNNKLKKMMRQLKTRIVGWQRNVLIEAYGEEIKPYSWDLTVTVQGLLKEYITVADQYKEWDGNEMATYIVDRLDYIKTDLLQTKPKPLFSEEEMENLLSPSPTLCTKDHVDILLSRIKIVIDSMNPSDNKEHLEQSFDMLIKELETEDPKVFLLDVLLHYFMKEEQLKSTATKLRSLLVGGEKWNI